MENKFKIDSSESFLGIKVVVVPESMLPPDAIAVMISEPSVTEDFDPYKHCAVLRKK